jgi:hypothetical protein
MPGELVRHPQLGVLEIRDNSGSGTLAFDGRSIPLRIELDGCGLDEVLSFAASIASALGTFDRISKEIIAADLLDTYNSGWNEYDEVQEDGTLKTVINPKLSSVEFQARFIMNGITITGDSSVDLWYEDGGLFWGHSVFVESLDGADFANARAQLFG